MKDKVEKEGGNYGWIDGGRERTEGGKEGRGRRVMEGLQHVLHVCSHVCFLEQ